VPFVPGTWPGQVPGGDLPRKRPDRARPSCQSEWVHRSRLSILLLDLPPDQHAAGRDFWSAATGRPAAPDPTDDRWASLGSFADGFHLAVQRTGEGTPPRWHVGIQTGKEFDRHATTWP
jgi:hypothetical protein